MRTGATIAVIIFTTLAVAAAAPAAPRTVDPTALVLRKADVPANATYEANDYEDLGFTRRLAAAGVQVEAANYLAFAFSSTKGSLMVSGVVLSAPSVAQARKGFALAKKQLDAFWRRTAAPVSVPSYGDQQFARYQPAGGEGIGTVELLVRKRTVIWLLNVKSERRPAVQRAELFAELAKYARKQQARVGRG
jgi:hypothetical protein